MVIVLLVKWWWCGAVVAVAVPSYFDVRWRALERVPSSHGDEFGKVGKFMYYGAPVAVKELKVGSLDRDSIGACFN